MAVQRTQAEINHAAAIGALAGTRGWQAVEKELEEKIQRIRGSLLLTVLEQDNDRPQRDIDFARGQLSILSWVLGMPERQEGIYERSVSGRA